MSNTFSGHRANRKERRLFRKAERIAANIDAPEGLKWRKYGDTEVRWLDNTLEVVRDLGHYASTHVNIEYDKDGKAIGLDAIHEAGADCHLTHVRSTMIYTKDDNGILHIEGSLRPRTLLATLRSAPRLSPDPAEMSFIDTGAQTPITEVN